MFIQTDLSETQRHSFLVGGKSRDDLTKPFSVVKFDDRGFTFTLNNIHLRHRISGGGC